MRFNFLFQKLTKSYGFAALVAVISVNLAAQRAEQSYPGVDKYLAEFLHPHEYQHAESIANSIAGSLRREYAGEQILRDAHPKAHGCLQAAFDVYPDIPESLQHGVFVPGRTYSAVVRFSNGNSDATRSDAKGDTRGMAIKLEGVPGSKLLEHSDQLNAQDFLLMSFPAFFIDDAADYDEFFSIINSGSSWGLLKLPFVLGFSGSVNAFKMLRGKISNPIKTRYWSVVPYQLGIGDQRVAVKYSARACRVAGKSDPESVFENDPDFLRKVLKESVATEPACMEFMIQISPKDASVERSVVEWSENESTFVPVAKLHFPAQKFDSQAQLEQCERMVFNPWHSLAAHRPLGAVNRIRKLVYERISQLRNTSRSE
ncbi:MAG: catalase family protein [Pseudomonadales bacterium]